LLEGTDVVVDGTISSNGAGGGGGAVNFGNASPGGDSVDGEARAVGGAHDFMPVGGDPVDEVSGDGGRGGAGAQGAGDPGVTADDGGGGGGGVGRIRINDQDGVAGGVGILSPAESTGLVSRGPP
jgi:hypothetical protein